MKPYKWFPGTSGWVHEVLNKLPVNMRTKVGSTGSEGERSRGIDDDASGAWRHDGIYQHSLAMRTFFTARYSSGLFSCFIRIFSLISSKLPLSPLPPSQPQQLRSLALFRPDDINDLYPFPRNRISYPGVERIKGFRYPAPGSRGKVNVPQSESDDRYGRGMERKREEEEETGGRAG